MQINFVEIPVKDTPRTARMIADKLIPEWRYQAAYIVPFVVQDSTKNIFKKLWQYCRKNYAYHEDPVGEELIRSPFQSKKDAKSGIDCEDFAIIVCSVLLHLGYSPTLRIVDFGNGWQHIYVLCNGVAIDPVNDCFNVQEDFVKKMDFEVGQLGMSGIPNVDEYTTAANKFIDTFAVNLRKNLRLTLFSNQPIEIQQASESKGIKRKSERFIVADFVFANFKKGAKLKDGYDGKRAMTNPIYKTDAIQEGNYGGALPKIAFDFFEYLQKQDSNLAETVKPITNTNSMNTNNNEDKFTRAIFEKLKNGEKLNKVSVTKIANSFGVNNDSAIKELTEYSIVMVCREIVSNDFSYKDTYADLVQFYKSQPNLSLRTSNSILLQQYSTPSPIAYLMGVYCRLFDKNTTVFESSAGNGLLTIASTNLKNIVVNEIDPQRNENLQKQGFQRVFSMDGSKDFDGDLKHGRFFDDLEFDAIVSNPPFGALGVKDREKFDGYEMKDLDHLMAIRALNKMKDDGKAAIIIGGHTNWDELGRVQAGKNRTFLNYLHKHYNVDDIVLINGDLFSRQGTSFDIRLILINGRKAKPEGVSPLKNDHDATVEKTFESLFDRVMDVVEFGKQNSVSDLVLNTIDDKSQSKLKLIKLKTLAAKAKLKLALI